MSPTFFLWVGRAVLGGSLQDEWPALWILPFELAQRAAQDMESGTFELGIRALLILVKPIDPFPVSLPLSLELSQRPEKLRVQGDGEGFAPAPPPLGDWSSGCIIGCRRGCKGRDRMEIR